MIGTWADSDFCGDPDSTRSTSGWVSVVRGEKSWALMDFGSKTQPGTAYTTPDSELRALADAIVRSAAVLHTLFTSLLGYQPKERLYTDNDAALSVTRAGYSKKLAYLRRTQKTSIGFLAD